MDTNVPLANAEHALFAQYLADRNPINKLLLGIAVPSYQAAKWTAQTIPGGRYLDYISPTPLYNATPPSWEQLMWGLAPFWGGVRR